MLPDMNASISSSEGFLLEASSAEADIIWPGWQYPHCGTSRATHAFCTLWLPPRPSMVVTFWPDTEPIGVWQERTAWPFRCTVQAPQSALPQPNFVPVMPSVSRSTQSNGVSGATSTLVLFPFTLNEIFIAKLPLGEE